MNLQYFPREIFALAERLEILDLSGNQLTRLPDDLDKLHNLRVLFCSDNRFTELPEVLGRCPNLQMIGFRANQITRIPPESLPPKLRWLILTDNRLDSLPAKIGECHVLQKLMLSGNRLSTLPEEISQCRKLELVRLASNRFELLPRSLLSLPNLAWLAFAGNPCTELLEIECEQNYPVSEIPWNTLEITRKLGEGASGNIFRANWQAIHAHARPVAAKIFKGSLSSDGLPLSEKKACIQAGNHPNLIPIHGKISGHPEDLKGMVMELVPDTFHNLADPPSLDSCTRDIYDSRKKFSADQILNLARGIASAAKHLHDRGILHGDLYAHNILHDAQGSCLLGDLGAASFYNPQDVQLADTLQRIDVRAFGILLEELLKLSDTRIKRLESLAERCLSEQIDQRPLFSAICIELESPAPK